ncbi:MAG: hypothetical protein FJ044_03850 [Candidatus Cloacimonetes bacterium]|nr:hypothetical protein [Candidatus Cloacimonadota bacterium]
MKITRSFAFLRDYARLSTTMQKRTDKTARIMREDMHHPSLRAKKMEPKKLNIWGARVTKGYRMTFLMTKHEIILLGVGPHNRGLGKK